MPEINYRDPRPIYEQLVDTFEKLILQGVIGPDDRMPSVRDTAAKFSVNPNTVQKAFAKLESDGYIYTVKGRGSFAADAGPLAEKKKKDFLEEFAASIERGRSLGIPRKELEESVKEIYGRSDDD